MSSAVTTLVEEQLAEVQGSFPGARAVALPGGITLVTVPDMPLPAGWSQPTTTVSFIVPVGYPMARPDCFFADPSLRLATGGMPMNTGQQALPGTAQMQLWFSWHLASWNPSTDTLLTYLRVIRDRLARVQ